LYEDNPDDIIKLCDLAFYNAIPEALPQLHASESPNVPPSVKFQEILSPGGTGPSSQLPTSHATGVFESNVDNSLHSDQLTVELRIPHSVSPKTNATAHKDTHQTQQLMWCLKLLAITHTLLKLFVEHYRIS
jgi:hypothetical protein